MPSDINLICVSGEKRGIEFKNQTDIYDILENFQCSVTKHVRHILSDKSAILFFKLAARFFKEIFFTYLGIRFATFEKM